MSRRPDAPLTYTFNEAGDYAKGLNKQKAHGRDDWRIPTKNELSELFKNRAAIGGFRETEYPIGWYWSSSPLYGLAWAQRFSDGNQTYGLRDVDSSLRCVR